MRIKNEMGRGILVSVGNNGEKIRNIASVATNQIRTAFMTLFRMFIFPPPQIEYHDSRELYTIIEKFSRKTSWLWVYTRVIMEPSQGKEVPQMSTEKEIIMFQKSTVYDLLQLIEKDPNKSYTVEELRELLAAYVKGLEQS